MAEAGELMEQVLRRADSDPEFREQLKSDPAAAVKTITGVDVPSGVRIVVVEDTVEQVHLVLPPPGASSQLSDSELEHVAGGQDHDSWCGMGGACGTVTQGW